MWYTCKYFKLNYYRTYNEYNLIIIIINLFFFIYDKFNS